METVEDPEILCIQENEAGQRLDVVLTARYSGRQSRTYFQSLIEQGNVLVNGTPVKKRYKPLAGDEVEVAFIVSPELDLAPENIPLAIVYEDKDILVINKPAGLVVHPAPGNWSGTFVNALMYHCQHLPITGEAVRPGIVHRLDKDTTGLLVAAKTAEAHQKLVIQFSERQVFKEYIALCYGKPKEGAIEAPIGRHPVRRKEMAVSDKGRSATTICKILKFDGVLSLVSLILETGRTHQIRVHLKHVGAPVLGDPVYGNASANLRYKCHRQMLHAHILKFLHPITGESLAFEAPLPDDMALVVNKFFK